MKNKKVPSIANLLDGMPAEGIDTQLGQFATYAAMGFAYDGTDRRNLSVRKLRAFVKELDQFAGEQLPGLSHEMIDEDDRVGVRVVMAEQATDYWFRCPSLADSIPADQNVPRYLRALIDKLGDTALYDLPYLTLPSVIAAGMTAAGFL